LQLRHEMVHGGEIVQQCASLLAGQAAGTGDLIEEHALAAMCLLRLCEGTEDPLVRLRVVVLPGKSPSRLAGSRAARACAVAACPCCLLALVQRRHLLLVRFMAWLVAPLCRRSRCLFPRARASPSRRAW
jgi:hypothetical protein